MPPLGAEINGLDSCLCASLMRKGVKVPIYFLHDGEDDDGLFPHSPQMNYIDMEGYETICISFVFVHREGEEPHWKQRKGNVPKIQRITEWTGKQLISLLHSVVPCGTIIQNAEGRVLYGEGGME